MKVRDVIKAMEKEGWRLDRTRGDHRQYIHPAWPTAGTVMCPVTQATIYQPER